MNYCTAMRYELYEYITLNYYIIISVFVVIQILKQSATNQLY